MPAGPACVLTLHTLFRRPLFRDPHAARAVAQLHVRAMPWRRSCWLAWVLMPDHWQGLVVLGPGDAVPMLAGRFKGMTTRAVDPRHLVNGWLWSRGCDERVLAVDEPLADAARNLVTAPRRAGLVERIGDYPYWDAAWLPDEAGAPAE
jgi:REP element-mobilizing transposase RayT